MRGAPCGIYASLVYMQGGTMVYICLPGVYSRVYLPGYT